MKTFASRSEAFPKLDVYAHLNDITTQAAILLNIDDAILTDWFNRQCGWWMTHAKKLAAAKQTPEIAARLAHATETIALLRKRQHVLVCRKHGVQGVQPDEWSATIPADPDYMGDKATALASFYVALANRGIFDLPEDGNYGEWERDCELCLRSVFKGVSETARPTTPDQPVTRSESAPVRPQRHSGCEGCGIEMSAVADGSLCGYCKRERRLRND